MKKKYEFAKTNEHLITGPQANDKKDNAEECGDVYLSFQACSMYNQDILQAFLWAQSRQPGGVRKRWVLTEFVAKETLYSCSPQGIEETSP